MMPVDERLLSGCVPEVEAALARLGEGERPVLARALVELAEGGKRPLLERIGAGSALALLGDPRIVTRAPRMLLVPGGSFLRGMRLEQAAEVAREYDLPLSWLAKACPQQEVEVDPFEIARFPVTQQEWAEFLAHSDAGERPRGWPSARPERGRENHPVHGVSHDAMLAYCDWLSGETGLRYRLPTEVEWEKAARGPSGRAYPWGERFDPRCANTREAGVGETTPVGVFPAGASPYGALDMAGNVEECTGSLYRLYPGSPVQDPEEGSYVVTRGGCFALDGDLARCDRRHGLPFAPAAGFRLARSRASAAADEASSQPQPSEVSSAREPENRR
jgi:formylglycine-generating enzyme required for sulfatase activity